MYHCEQCGKEVYEPFGSGRFCSRSCSNKWVALHQSAEAKARKIEAGKDNLEIGRGNRHPNSYVFTNEDRAKGQINRSLYYERLRKEWLLKVLSDEIEGYLCSYTKLRDRLIEFGYKSWVCDNCGNTEWLGKPIPLEVHHINGYSNSLDNIQFLCPNCHSLTPNNGWNSYNSRKSKKL